MMEMQRVEEVDREAERLLSRIADLKESGDVIKIAGMPDVALGLNAAAVRRASMDLTRALAGMRNGARK